MNSVFCTNKTGDNIGMKILRVCYDVIWERIETTLIHVTALGCVIISGSNQNKGYFPDAEMQYGNSQPAELMLTKIFPFGVHYK